MFFVAFRTATVARPLSPLNRKVGYALANRDALNSKTLTSENAAVIITYVPQENQSAAFENGEPLVAEAKKSSSHVN